jgi:hypothetical protein
MNEEYVVMVMMFSRPFDSRYSLHYPLGRSVYVCVVCAAVRYYRLRASSDLVRYYGIGRG